MIRGDQLQTKMYLLLSLESGQTVNFILMYSSKLLFSRGSITAHFIMLRLETEFPLCRTPILRHSPDGM
jgi:hypothetical protein